MIDALAAVPASTDQKKAKKDALLNTPLKPHSTFPRRLSQWLECAAQRFPSWNCRESGQTCRVNHDVGASMSTGEILLYVALLIWGPPLVLVGFLMRPSRRAG